jgi:hypothetical protein
MFEKVALPIVEAVARVGNVVERHFADVILTPGLSPPAAIDEQIDDRHIAGTVDIEHQVGLILSAAQLLRMAAAAARSPAARQAGNNVLMKKGEILAARYHGGSFCFWPTFYTYVNGRNCKGRCPRSLNPLILGIIPRSIK